MPLLFAGGVCCCVGAAFGVEAGLLAELDGVDELAGALEGAGAGAGLELEPAAAEPDEPEAELDAGCDASLEASLFLERFFLVVVVLVSAAVDEPEALELEDAGAVPEAGAVLEAG